MFINNDISKLNSLNLPVFSDANSFADTINLSHRLIYFLTYCPDSKKYKCFNISKKDGTARTIYSPCMSLKVVQKWILENILYKNPVSNFTYGFSKGYSSPTKNMALAHIEYRYLLKIDLKDFFPSINIVMVKKIFHRIGYGTTASGVLSHLCCYDNFLPQGAVTSPYISNLITYHMDKRIGGYCSKHNIIYTRYADDMCFSSNNKHALNVCYRVIEKIIEDEGFCINNCKTHIISNFRKKSILGVTINDELIKADKDLKKKVRSMIHHAIISGDYSNRESILGYISYIQSIEDDYIVRVKNYISKFYKSEIIYDKDKVTSYNKNKFLKDMNDIIYYPNIINS